MEAQRIHWKNIPMEKANVHKREMAEHGKRESLASERTLLAQIVHEKNEIWSLSVNLFCAMHSIKKNRIK